MSAIFQRLDMNTSLLPYVVYANIRIIDMINHKQLINALFYELCCVIYNTKHFHDGGLSYIRSQCFM